MLTFANEQKKRVYFFSEDIDELIEYFEQNSDGTLIINFDKYFDYRHQKDYFKNINLIKYKKVLLNGIGSFNFNLQNLKSNENLLEMDDNYSEIPYDFSGFPKLEVLRYLYIKGSSNYSLLTHLKELSLWSYPKKSIEEFLDLKSNLEEMRFVQSKLQHLRNISYFNDLKRLFLIADKDLEFDSFGEVNLNVTELYIDNCKKININLIPNLFPSLEKLTIMKNGEVKELKYILDNLKNLRELNLMGTKILESDNRYWKNYSNIEKLYFLDQKNLILKSDEFEK